MLFSIDVNGARPLADQIAAQVRAAIATGELAPGERLPAARELAASLEINLHTVLRGYAQLRDGLIELRRGRGATVMRTAPANRARLNELIAAVLDESARLGISRRELAHEISTGNKGTP